MLNGVWGGRALRGSMEYGEGGMEYAEGEGLVSMIMDYGGYGV